MQRVKQPIVMKRILLFFLLLAHFGYGQYPLKTDLKFNSGMVVDLPNGNKTTLYSFGQNLCLNFRNMGFELREHDENGKWQLLSRIPNLYKGDTIVQACGLHYIKGDYFLYAFTMKHGFALFKIERNDLVLIKAFPEYRLPASLLCENKIYLPNPRTLRVYTTQAMGKIYFNAPTEVYEWGYKKRWVYELWESDGTVSGTRRMPLKSNTRLAYEPGVLPLPLATKDYLLVRRYINSKNDYYSSFCYLITKTDTFRIDSDLGDDFFKSNTSGNKFYGMRGNVLSRFDIVSGTEREVLGNMPVDRFDDITLSPNDVLFFSFRRPTDNTRTYGICDLKNDTTAKIIDVGTLNGVEYSEEAQWYDNHWWVTAGKMIHQLTEDGKKVNEFVKSDLTNWGGTVFKVGETFMVSYQDSLKNFRISTFMDGKREISYPMSLISVNRQFPAWVLCINQSGYYLLKGDPAVQVRVYDDDNGNGKFDLGELGIRNVSVWLEDELVTTNGFGFALKTFKEKPSADLAVRLGFDGDKWNLSPNNDQNFTVDKDSILGLKTINVGLIRQFSHKIKFTESRPRCRSKRKIAFYLENTSEFAMKATAMVKLDSLNKVQSFSDVFEEKENGSLYIGSFSLEPGGETEAVFRTIVGDSMGAKIKNQLEVTIEFSDTKTVKKRIVNDSRIRCSYDPNDKASSTIGVSKDSFLLQTDTSALKYLIRFQNVGNDTAYNVEIVDQLSEHLDVSTFKYLGSSHEPNISITDGMELKFDFQNIMLPDSGTNQLGSNGFVNFSIKPKANLIHRTNITNKAAIYFDFNDPVITNTTSDVIVHNIPIDAPILTSATLRDAMTIQLDYKSSDPFAKGVEIYRSVNDTLNYKLVHTDVSSSTQWLDRWHKEDATFYYKVRAVNGVEKSGWSETKSLVYRKSGIDNSGLRNMVKVFPNPARNQLNVQMKAEQSGQLLLLDMNGKQILQQIISGSTVVEVGHLPKGPYMLKVEVNGQQMEKLISLQ